MEPPFTRMPRSLSDSQPRVGLVGVSQEVDEFLPKEPLEGARKCEELPSGRFEKLELVGSQPSPAFWRTFPPGIRFSLVQRFWISE